MGHTMRMGGKMKLKTGRGKERKGEKGHGWPLNTGGTFLYGCLILKQEIGEN